MGYVNPESWDKGLKVAKIPLCGFTFCSTGSTCHSQAGSPSSSQNLAINLSLLLVASARSQLSHLEIWLVTDLMARRGWARVPCKTHPHIRPLNEWAHSVGLMVQGGTGESKLRSPLISPLISFLPPPFPSPSFPSHQFQGSKFFLPFPNSGIRNFPSSEFTVCLHYFSLTVIKQHNQGSLWKKALNLGLTLSES